ncbi:hypothetical protein G6F46_000625 [Rhizopus delemar]|uniref:Uncharacterized protein n=3 Tax=Rhizopus TaxID=4842 RepID=I1CAZ7_RHIO9|nr:hypothetical protein RO3G_10337 [Rhizopus delemar RA 99-880]KAG1462352.1 hypothetical protein G6F55_003013 [Rhizopus delemar]KAG1550813.1 hypothetical protein G6F51_002232 [Rhizopus arrhizus]KAG1505234.1 hypothetical protein G6F54_000444 [Rhizopus delemar]KAG1518674.1 hypothetical protein G6F53_000408 [Rhizopus delemar]|eukprot:EIE85627.1 hypothetical protein RO3G_10337 [Rhizopus delemar RA 99-880]
MSATTKSLQVYENANKGLLTLTELWETMLKIIRSVSTASGSSLTVEPDLVALQKSRQDLESLLRTLRSTTNWLETNELPEKNKAEEIESKEYIELMRENKMATEEADRVTEQLRRLLNKSYALQLQMEMLHVSSQESHLN